MARPDSSSCTGCEKIIFSGVDEPRIHPVLDVLLCTECDARHRSESFSLAKDGFHETACRWCSRLPGSLPCATCSDCPYIFCIACIVRNLAQDRPDEVNNAFYNKDNWLCLRCRRETLQTLVTKQREFMRRHRAAKATPPNVKTELNQPITELERESSDTSQSGTDLPVISDVRTENPDVVKTESESESDTTDAAQASSAGFEYDSDSLIRPKKAPVPVTWSRKDTIVDTNSESGEVSECATSGAENDAKTPITWTKKTSNNPDDVISVSATDVADGNISKLFSDSDGSTRQSPFTVETLRIENVVHVSPPNSQDLAGASIELDVGPTGDSQEKNGDITAAPSVTLESENTPEMDSDVPDVVSFDTSDCMIVDTPRREEMEEKPTGWLREPLKAVCKEEKEFIERMGSPAVFPGEVGSSSAEKPNSSDPTPAETKSAINIPSTPDESTEEMRKIRQSSQDKLRSKRKKRKGSSFSSPQVDIKPDTDFIDLLDPDLPTFSGTQKIKSEPKIGDMANIVNDFFKSEALLKSPIAIEESSDDDLPSLVSVLSQAPPAVDPKPSDSGLGEAKSEDRRPSKDGYSNMQPRSVSPARSATKRPRICSSSDSEPPTDAKNKTPKKKAKLKIPKSPRGSKRGSDSDSSSFGSIKVRSPRRKRKKSIESSDEEDTKVEDESEEKVKVKKEKKPKTGKKSTSEDDMASLFTVDTGQSQETVTSDDDVPMSKTAQFMFKPLSSPLNQSRPVLPGPSNSLLPSSGSDLSDSQNESDTETKGKKKMKHKVKKTASEEDRGERSGEESDRSRDSDHSSRSRSRSRSRSGSRSASSSSQCSSTDADSDADTSKDSIRSKDTSNEAATALSDDEDFTPESQANFSKSRSSSPKLKKEDDDDELPNLERKKKKKKRKKRRKVWSDEEDFKDLVKKKETTNDAENLPDGYSAARKRKGNNKNKKKYERPPSEWGRLYFKRKHKPKACRPQPDQPTPPTQPTPPSQRRNVRAVLSNPELKLATRRAQSEEKARRRRLDKRRKEFSAGPASVPDDQLDVVTKELVLEWDLITSEPKVEVDRHLIRKLKPHQVEAVQFMWDCVVETVALHSRTNGSGCLLAHCMGLGKTLSVIAFVHTILRYPELLAIKTVLVISPLNTVLNWEQECDKWLKDLPNQKDRPRVFEMSKYKKHGERAGVIRDWRHRGGILIIGYAMFRNLAGAEKVKNATFKQVFQEGLMDPDAGKFLLGADLVVCDEGHILRNCATTLSTTAQQVTTRRRIVLTGTPLQNNLREYWTMVNFVKPNLLGTKKEFSNQFINPITNGQCADSTEKDVRAMKARSHVLHDMLAGIILRKDYAALTPYLPAKYEYVLSIKLGEKQRHMYLDYLAYIFKDRDWTEDQVYGKGGKLFSDFHNLSKICTHPWVFKIQQLRQQENKPLDEVDSQKMADTQWRWWTKYLEASDETNMELSGKLVILFEILAKAEKLGDKVLVFSQSLLTLDLIEDFLQRANRAQSQESSGMCGGRKWQHGKTYFRLDGTTNAQFRQSASEEFNRIGNHSARLFLISTRAGSLGINLFAANRVIVFDACWNPSYDIQAMFRAYRFGQRKRVFVYRFLAQGTMEEKIYDRQVTKQSLSHRVIDEHQIDRHYTQNELAELYKYEDPEAARLRIINKRGTPPCPKEDDILAELLTEQSDLLITYHMHDSLLKNREDEQLTEQERQAAWAAYEAEKAVGSMALPTRDVPADVIQAVMEYVRELNMDAAFVREALDILYTQNPNYPISTLVNHMLIYWRDQDSFERAKRPYMNTLDHRDYLNVPSTSGVSPSPAMPDASTGTSSAVQGTSTSNGAQSTSIVVPVTGIGAQSTNTTVPTTSSMNPSSSVLNIPSYANTSTAKIVGQSSNSSGNFEWTAAEKLEIKRRAAATGTTFEAYEQNLRRQQRVFENVRSMAKAYEPYNMNPPCSSTSMEEWAKMSGKERSALWAAWAVDAASDETKSKKDGLVPGGDELMTERELRAARAAYEAENSEMSRRQTTATPGTGSPRTPEAERMREKLAARKAAWAQYEAAQKAQNSTSSNTTSGSSTTSATTSAASSSMGVISSRPGFTPASTLSTRFSDVSLPLTSGPNNLPAYGTTVGPTTIASTSSAAAVAVPNPTDIVTYDGRFKKPALLAITAPGTTSSGNPTTTPWDYNPTTTTIDATRRLNFEQGVQSPSSLTPSGMTLSVSTPVTSSNLAQVSSSNIQQPPASQGPAGIPEPVSQMKLSRAQMAKILGEEKMQQMDAQKKVHLSPNSTNTMKKYARNMMMGNAGQTHTLPSSPLAKGAKAKTKRTPHKQKTAGETIVISPEAKASTSGVSVPALNRSDSQPLDLSPGKVVLPVRGRGRGRGSRGGKGPGRGGSAPPNAAPQQAGDLFVRDPATGAAIRVTPRSTTPTKRGRGGGRGKPAVSPFRNQKRPSTSPYYRPQTPALRGGRVPHIHDPCAGNISGAPGAGFTSGAPGAGIPPRAPGAGIPSGAPGAGIPSGASIGAAGPVTSSPVMPTHSIPAASMSMYRPPVVQTPVRALAPGAPQSAIQHKPSPATPVVSQAKAGRVTDTPRAVSLQRQTPPQANQLTQPMPRATSQPRRAAPQPAPNQRAPPPRPAPPQPRAPSQPPQPRGPAPRMPPPAHQIQPFGAGNSNSFTAAKLASAADKAKNNQLGTVRPLTPRPKVGFRALTGQKKMDMSKKP